MPLQGRDALITGANQGLGKAIADAYVRAGANVLLTARGADLLEAAAAELRGHICRKGQIIATLPGDVAEPADAAAMVARAQEVLPNLAILVNNAGIYGPMGRVEDNDWDAWTLAMRINCFGTILMCRQVMPRFRRQGYGKIINLSGGGATSPLPHFSAYAASKAAVVRFTETLAEECRGTRIDVNAIAPGPLNTRLLDQVLAAGPGCVGAAFHAKALQQRDSGGTALGRGAALAVFLGSTASDGITGRLLSAVWDDWASLPAKREQLACSDIFTLRRIVPEDRREQWPAA